LYSLREFWISCRQRKIGNCYRCGFAANSEFFRGGISSPFDWLRTKCRRYWGTKYVRTNSRILHHN